MSESQAVRSRAVATSYDLMGELLAEVYGDNIHYGYWIDDDDDSPLPVAQDRLSDLLAGKLGVAGGDHVLDVGCGTGAPTRRLAVNTGATATGITVSRWQVEQATRAAAEAGLADRVRFELADAAQLPFDAGTFDAAMIVEVLVHVADKRRVLAEVARVLRPGARLVIAEVVQTAPMRPELAARWTAMPMSEVPSLSEYVDMVDGAGFTVDEAGDHTSHIRRSFAALRQAVAAGGPKLASTYGPRVLKYGQQGVLDMQEVAEACLGYVVVTATKPS